MSEWIDSEKKLPPLDDPYNKTYLVFGKMVCGTCQSNMHVFEARWCARKGWFERGEYDCPVDATHWMPLPEPPCE